VLTDFPRRFASTARVFLSAGGPSGTSRQAFTVQRARLQGHFVLLKLEGLDTRDAAERWRNALVDVPAEERVPLPRGHYFWEDIIGLTVRTEDGEELGRVREILETGANDVYVVKGSGGERLIPAIKQVVTEIAPERGEMVVSLLPGL
jgi:16S rRNA processing protein RimM